MSQENILSVIQNGAVDTSSPTTALRVLGIDLGTTNSTISESFWEVGGKPSRSECLDVVQPTLEGEYTNELLPSVVALHQGKVFIGEGAKRLQARSSELGMKQNQDIFYECKNEIGNLRTYHRGQPGFRSPAEIGSKIIVFLYNAALNLDSQPVDRVVVTVPASFQAAQRQDTLEAARLAGLELTGGDLLDEPVAAFLDYLITQGENLKIESVDLQNDELQNLVVFDFGGGTCDVAVFGIQRTQDKIGALNIAPLAVSRYHRLGGGDIDAAIVHEILIPQLCEQNKINPLNLKFSDKKHNIEPALLGVAEMLKEGLSIEIRRLKNFAKYDDHTKSELIKTHPGTFYCRLDKETVTLTSPKLTARQFEKILEPFLDQDLLFARETEYRMTCSIFAPLQDALDRAGVDQQDINFCLAVGGSSLITEVSETLETFFTNAQILTYPRREETKTCVSRGAAAHALALEAFNRPFIQPISHDGISIKTSNGTIPLIAKGTRLPYPADSSFAKSFELAVPQTVMLETCELRVEVIAESDGRDLQSKIWSISGPVNRGTSICLEYRIDENQVLHLQAHLKDNESAEPFHMKSENPLTNIVNPQPKRLQIERMEEDLRTGVVANELKPEKIAEIAELYADIGQRDKAVEFLQRAIRAKNQPDAVLLNRLAGYYGVLGDDKREEKMYREAARISSWSGPWFNLSLAFKRQGKFAQAADAVKKALEREKSAPYLVQAALIAEKQNDTTKSQSLVSEAMTLFDPLKSLSDWELGWYVTATRFTGEDEKMTKARTEQKHRQRLGKNNLPDSKDGILPESSSGIMLKGMKQ